MDFKKLFKMQDQLDSYINEVKGLSGHDVMQERILALIVEIGEFANETRCFKFWSDKPASDKEVILFEYVDCMHFLLSIGNYSGFTFRDSENMEFENDIQGSLTELFIEFYFSVVHFRNLPRPDDYLIMWDYFMSIGNKLGFTEQEIYDSYLEKNEVNYERQASGY